MNNSFCKHLVSRHKPSMKHTPDPRGKQPPSYLCRILKTSQTSGTSRTSGRLPPFRSALSHKVRTPTPLHPYNPYTSPLATLKNHLTPCQPYNSLPLQLATLTTCYPYNSLPLQLATLPLHHLDRTHLARTHLACTLTPRTHLTRTLTPPLLPLHYIPSTSLPPASHLPAQPQTKVQSP
ncbi:hypothetical protein PtA15_10A612 [Puccinia triticina]|uniref:Uncharacterized protein n=1 Tax=Puccinia triticina TaxID=208348 RepID=A0ABY7CXW1_9BASI|nr:uncharacterized protein PtA15_10A612 [Puccinia triticina]WAQ89188.1 hypothetical protein PtA15_10A612 [Puccinia triticina]